MSRCCRLVHGIRKVHLAKQLFGFWPLSSQPQAAHQLPKILHARQSAISTSDQRPRDRDQTSKDGENKSERESRTHMYMSTCHTMHKVSMGQVPGIGHIQTQIHTHTQTKDRLEFAMQALVMLQDKKAMSRCERAIKWLEMCSEGSTLRHAHTLIYIHIYI